MALLLKRLLPLLLQPFQRKQCIGRAGGGALDRLSSGLFLAVFSVKMKGGVAVGYDFFNVCRAQDPVDIRRNDIADALVAGPLDIAGGNHIPHRDSMAQQQSFFLLDGFGNRFSGQAGDQFPEPVLGASVVKIRFPGFDGWKAAED